jgi:hypothetical protein
MNTSPFARLFRPTGSTKLSQGTLGYICARARQRAYNLLVSEFKKSGISQTDLAKRLDKSPELICRWLGRPGNLEIDTLSAAVFAINGGILTFNVSYPVKNVIIVSKDKHTAAMTDTKTANNVATNVIYRAAA